MAERKHRRVVQQPDHRANRTILVRTLILLAVFGVAVFSPLFVRLWQIQIRDYDRFQELAVEQQTGDSVVAAQRGVIYDRCTTSSSPPRRSWPARRRTPTT